MTKLIRLFFVSILIVLAMASCSWFTNDPQAASVLATPSLSPTTIELTVKADASTLTAAGQMIKYVHTVRNAGAAAVTGPVAVTGAVCPELPSVGNLDANFDAGETFACTSEYTVTQADLDRGSVVNITTATISGINSNAVTTTISKAPPVVLNLSKTANPVTYDQIGQVITYTYVIMNSGTATLGPAQFTVTDAAFSAPINCGDATASLASAANLSCTKTYTITQADMDAGSVSTAATASGGGAATDQPVSTTVTKGAAAPSNPINPNLTTGSTVQHKVMTGEWVWQIARCYGVEPAKVLQANPQLTNPGYISPNTNITVPNIGSLGKIYGPPCVGTYTVQNGDSWESIAQKYNADVAVLKMVNKNTLSVGQVITVPLNSAGGISPVVK